MTGDRSPRQPRDAGRVDPLLEVREKRRGKRLGDAYVRIVRPCNTIVADVPYHLEE